MSQALPRPPPPLLPTAITGKHVGSNAHPKLELQECLWAKDYPELQKACYLASVCQQKAPRQCLLRNVPGILQQGPTCGLTALSMLLGGAPSPQQLLEAAKQQNYTNNGEMFSAQYLYRMICDNLQLPEAKTNTPIEIAAGLAKKCDNEYSSSSNSNKENCVRHAECQLYEGQLDCAKIREALIAGSCLFVPYDPDYNHSPCIKLGHKAHWALVIGFLITTDDEFYVLARHGKARNLAVWSLAALSDSNANLIEFAQPKGYPDCDFVLPPGGIAGELGLKERAIIVNELPQQIINIR